MNNMLSTGVEVYLDELIERYPKLSKCKESIQKAYIILKNSYLNGGKLLVAGNGGSAADSEHIVGELMKSFRRPRPIPKDMMDKICAVDKDRGNKIVKVLECSLPAISLVSQTALSTAYLNDIGDSGIFAQQVLGYGILGDVFLGISTSGNSENVIDAAIVAKAKGLSVISLTGINGGLLETYSDVCIKVPERETFKVQEFHLPIYHCLCLMLEKYFFSEVFSL
ncbi:MAG: SIS domain-containing protein [Veillonella parvula]|jgi:hypothetical protein|nr:SIS domain-containing protein [Veillonella parvula]